MLEIRSEIKMLPGTKKGLRHVVETFIHAFKWTVNLKTNAPKLLSTLISPKAFTRKRDTHRTTCVSRVTAKITNPQVRCLPRKLNKRLECFWSEQVPVTLDVASLRGLINDNGAAGSGGGRAILNFQHHQGLRQTDQYLLYLAWYWLCSRSCCCSPWLSYEPSHHKVTI